MSRSVQLLVLALAAVVGCPSSAYAATSLDVSIGWDGSVRPGRWTPLFVTLSDPATRQVLIELDMPQAGPYVMELRQFATIGPYPTTLTLYVPAQAYYSDPPTVAVRDADSRNLLARWPQDPEGISPRFEMTVRSNDSFIGVTGPVLRLAGFEQYCGSNVRVGGIKPEVLPDQPVGYDPLDLLVLHRADLNTIERSRQQAIVDWVRQGGTLLLWPSPEPTPASSPIGQILPCQVGGPRNFVISSEQRSEAGLQERFKGIVGYELSPTADAESIELLRADSSGDAMTAYARTYGFGRVIVSPINLNEISFQSSSKGQEFFQPVLAGTGLGRVQESSSSYYGYDPVSQLQQNSISRLQDHLANVPGAGRFGFSYVVWVVLGMMAVVGPVDWFVLRRLGRQPWTWVTTTGWIATITIGALFIGQIFKSGDLHFRTVTLIDQAGDETIARTTLLGIYSPRTTEYHLDAPSSQLDAQGKPVPTLQPPTGWWEPASATQYGGGGGMKVDVPFRQTTQGNLPQAMTINVWNMRTLRGENLVPGEPILKADLSHVPASGTTGDSGASRRVRGTITNMSPHPLKDIRIVVQGGTVAPPGERAKPASPPQGTRAIEEYNPNDPSRRESWMLQSSPLVLRLEPGQSVEIDGEVVSAVISGRNDEGMASRRYYGDVRPPDPDDIWAMATGLSGRRAKRVDELVSSGEHAAIYATIDGAEPPAVLRDDEGAIERHETVVRAVVPLKKER